MYVLNTLLTVNFVLPTETAPPAEADLDIVTEAPDGTITYVDDAILTYTPATVLTQGSATYAFTANQIGRWRLMLAIGTAADHVVEGSSTIFVVSPTLGSVTTDINRKLVTALGTNAVILGPFLPAGLESGVILDAALSASSNFGGQGPDKGRLNDVSSWATFTIPEANSWWKVDLGAIVEIGDLYSQGSPIAAEWITGYQIDYNNDDSAVWTLYNSGEILVGNVDQNSIVMHNLIPFTARYVRIKPQTYVGWISGRFELYIR